MGCPPVLKFILSEATLSLLFWAAGSRPTQLLGSATRSLGCWVEGSQ